MGKKMKLPYMVKAATETSGAAPLRRWPASNIHNNPNKSTDTIPPSFSTIYFNSCYEESFSYLSQFSNLSYNDVVLSDLRSERLLFVEPGETSSILELAKSNHNKQLQNPVAALTTAIESTNPFLDFRVSMGEMVDAYDLKEWESLEELLTWYLKVNERSNHGYIVRAFVDLVLHLNLPNLDLGDDFNSSSSATQCSFTSPVSYFSSSN